MLRKTIFWYLTDKSTCILNHVWFSYPKYFTAWSMTWFKSNHSCSKVFQKAAHQAQTLALTPQVCAGNGRPLRPLSCGALGTPNFPWKFLHPPPLPCCTAARMTNSKPWPMRGQAMTLVSLRDNRASGDFRTPTRKMTSGREQGSGRLWKATPELTSRWPTSTQTSETFHCLALVPLVCISCHDSKLDLQWVPFIACKLSQQSWYKNQRGKKNQKSTLFVP